jgi:hypothetical protein
MIKISSKVKNLKHVDNRLEGTVKLPCWADYNLPDGKKYDGKVQLNIGEFLEEKPHEMTEAEAKAIAYLLANYEQQQSVILAKLLEEYPKWQPDYGYSPEDALLFMPDVISTDDFKKSIVLSQIHILPVEHEGVAYYGYEFNTHWDEEHGMGCMFHKDRLVDFGLAESSFVIWRAQSDKDAQAPKPDTGLLFDPEKIKAALYQFTVKGFKQRVAEKPDLKDIYALAYDFDLVYNRVHLSLNSLEDHAITMAEYKELSYMKDTISTEEGIKEVKYSPGDFRHCAFDTFKPLSEAEDAPFQALFAAEETPENTEKRDRNYDALAEAITETLAIYAKGEEVKLLPITPDVYFIAANHDEPYLEAAARIKKYL